MKFIDDLHIQMFADGADLPGIRTLSEVPFIRGFTTNPTLMRKSGVKDYAHFAKEVLALIGKRPVSFEVFADEFDEMEMQALKIASWGPNVNVKIPVTNTRGESSEQLVERLARAGIQVNVTALMTIEQVRRIAACLKRASPSFISVFAGRVADTGRDPVPMMAEAVRVLEDYPNIKLIWASPRELLNIFQADAIGCHVITVTSDVLKKLPLVGKSLDDYSLETVQMFYRDARSAGYQLPHEPVPVLPEYRPQVAI